MVGVKVAVGVSLWSCRSLARWRCPRSSAGEPGEHDGAPAPCLALCTNICGQAYKTCVRGGAFGRTRAVFAAVAPPIYTRLSQRKGVLSGCRAPPCRCGDIAAMPGPRLAHVDLLRALKCLRLMAPAAEYKKRLCSAGFRRCGTGLWPSQAIRLHCGNASRVSRRLSLARAPCRFLSWRLLPALPLRAWPPTGSIPSCVCVARDWVTTQAAAMANTKYWRWATPSISAMAS